MLTVTIQSLPGLENMRQAGILADGLRAQFCTETGLAKNKVIIKFGLAVLYHSAHPEILNDKFKKTPSAVFQPIIIEWTEGCKTRNRVSDEFISQAANRLANPDPATMLDKAYTRWATLGMSAVRSYWSYFDPRRWIPARLADS